MKAIKVMIKSYEDIEPVYNKLINMGYMDDDQQTRDGAYRHTMRSDFLAQVCFICRKSGLISWGWSDEWFHEQDGEVVTVEELLKSSRICFEKG